MKFIQIIAIVGIIILLVYMVYKLVQKYKVYINIKTDYNIFFGTDITDPITHDKLMTCWKKTAYSDFFMNTIQSIEESKNEKILFVGLCQDHGEYALKVWMPIIEGLSKHFEDYRVVIVENDSKDNTRKILLDAAKKNPKIVILCDADMTENAPTCNLGIRSINNRSDKEKTLENRVRILANFRQIYWDYIQSKYPDYNYMCVVDWDLDGVLSVPGFFHGLYYTRHHTDVIACNSYSKNPIGKYQIHDTYPLLNHYRCEYLKKNKSTEDKKMNEWMQQNLLFGSTYPVSVGSAFGGLAIYNIQKIKHKNPRYTAQQICPIECEHTTFHRNLQVHIDPWMTLYIIKNRH